MRDAETRSRSGGCVGASATTGPNERLERGLALVLAALILINLLLLLATMGWVVGVRRDLTYPESAVAWGAWRAAAGEAVYTDWRLWPHHFAPYGPLVYYPVGWLGRALGLDRFGFGYFGIGRIESLAALLGITALGGLLARRIGCGRVVAWVGGGGLFSLWPRLWGFGASFRPDAPMVFLNMLAVWVALGGLGDRQRRWAVMACLWLAAGFKPAGWAAPLAIGWLAWRELGGRRALGWGLIYLAGGAAAFAALDAATGGLFRLNTVTALANGFAFPAFLREFGESDLRASLDLVPRLVVPAALGAWFFARRGERPAVRAAGLYAALTLVVGLGQMAKVGSDINYLLEAYALGGVTMALAWERLSEAREGVAAARRARLWRWLGAVALVVWPLSTVLPDGVMELKRFSGRAAETLAEPLASRSPAPSLLMDAAFAHPDRRTHALDDPLLFCIMLEAGRLSDAALVERIGAREFRTIALSPVARDALARHPAAARIRRAIETHYRLAATDGPTEIRTPK